MIALQITLRMLLLSVVVGLIRAMQPRLDV